MKKGINRLQMGLFGDLIKLKCHSEHFPTFWKNFFEKRLFVRMITIGGMRDQVEWGHEGPRGSIMPPRQPIMPKRTAYYAY